MTIRTLLLGLLCLPWMLAGCPAPDPVDDDTMADDDTGDDDVEADDDTGVEVESEVGAGCSCRSVSSRGSLPLLAPIAMLALWMRTLRARRTARRG